MHYWLIILSTYFIGLKVFLLTYSLQGIVGDIHAVLYMTLEAGGVEDVCGFEKKDV